MTVQGGDAAIADVVREHPGARAALEPTSDSDVARAVGIAGRSTAGATELPFDVMDLDDGTLVVNAVVLGIPPDRLRHWHRRGPVVVRVDGRPCFDGDATTVVIATGQYLRGSDLVPRGHPGDDRVEVQVYALDPGQRRRMRRRLATGDHVPHPAIVESAGRSVQVQAPSAWALEVDGRPRGARRGLAATVRGGAWSLVL